MGARPACQRRQHAAEAALRARLAEEEEQARRDADDRVAGHERRQMAAIDERVVERIAMLPPPGTGQSSLGSFRSIWAVMAFTAGDVRRAPPAFADLASGLVTFELVNPVERPEHGRRVVVGVSHGVSPYWRRCERAAHSRCAHSVRA